MDKVIYTALFGNYEELKEPTVITPGWQYLCYTDQPLTSQTWTIIHTEPMPTAQLTARWFKIMGFVDFHQSIWVDAAFIIHVNLDEFWDKYHQGDLSSPAHPHRDCIYNEIAAVIQSNRADKEKMLSIQSDYKARGIKENGGVISSGILMRQNTAPCIGFCEAWWKVLIDQQVNRDQVAIASLPNYREMVHMFRFNYTLSTEMEYRKHYKYR